jgi:hypothetical protein
MIRIMNTYFVDITHQLWLLDKHKQQCANVICIGSTLLTEASTFLPIGIDCNAIDIIHHVT